jgi:hypothetical protein
MKRWLDWQLHRLWLQFASRRALHESLNERARLQAIDRQAQAASLAGQVRRLQAMLDRRTRVQLSVG